MLNIKTRISLSKEAKRKIKVQKYKTGTFHWGNINKSVKNELSKKLIYNQAYRCAYCERYVFGLTPEIDHFCDKARYPEFTFVTTNLFYSCGECNSSKRKGRKNVVQIRDSNYRLCVFKIVHPLIHNPELEIQFTDPDRILLDYAKCTPLGRKTIEIFGFDDFTMTFIRSRTLLTERHYKFVKEEQRNLIFEAITYK